MKLIVSLCVLAVAVASASSLNKVADQVKEAFTRHEIVPRVVKSYPEDLVKVEYKKSSKVVNLGNELKPKEVAEQPMVSFNADPKAFYTLLMVDPDAPSRKAPTAAEWQHWLVVNIPGADVAKGQILTAYQPSAPPKLTGFHRYIFLVFKQPTGKMEFQEPIKAADGKDRSKFSTQKFVEKYKLGNPVAGNLFQAQHEEAPKK